MGEDHWLGTLLNRSYPWLLPLLAAAAFAPALMGKMKHAREFLLANFAAFAIGLPLFALLPAVGPWYCYHLAANPAQAACWAQLLALRVPGPYIFQEQAAGVVCFPSFSRRLGHSVRLCLVGISTDSHSSRVAFVDDHRFNADDWLALLQRCTGGYCDRRSLDGDCQSLCCIGREPRRS